MKRPTLDELSLTEKIAQLLMVGDERLQYKPTEKGNVIRPKEEIDEILKRCQFGSYWHTGSIRMNIVDLAEEWATGQRMTIEDSKAYIDDIQKNVRIPMLVAMDAENGVGYALASGNIIPSPPSIAAVNDLELTKELYAGVAREMRAAGANWRWVPVVDKLNRYSSSISRIFSDDPDKVTAIATAAIRGTESENVASTVKHFPGSMGYGIRDAHFTSSDMDAPFDEWYEVQGKIFQNMIDANVMTIMVGHESFSTIDDTQINGKYIPCTLSRKVVQGLLREKMGFKGVIITDAMGMASVNAFYPTYEEMVVAAINAGNDILLGVIPEAFDMVYKAVEDGRISMERIEESCERVLDLKEKIGLFDDKIRNEVIDVKAATESLKQTCEKISEKSATLLYDKINIIPVSKDKVKDVTIIYASHYNGTGEQLKVMKEEFEKRGARANIYNGMPPGGIDEAAKSDLIIYVGYVAMHRPMGLPTLYGNQLSMFIHAFSKGREKSIGVSMGYPYLHFDVMTGAETFVNIYSPDPEAQRAFVKGIYGEIPFVGKSPFDLEPKLRQIYC